MESRILFFQFVLAVCAAGCAVTCTVAQAVMAGEFRWYLAVMVALCLLLGAAVRIVWKEWKDTQSPKRGI